MNIIQQPDNLSLSQNLRPFLIGTVEAVSFELKKGTVTLLSQRYEPGENGLVEIDIRDVVHSQLSYRLLQSGEVYEQPSLTSDFTAVIDNNNIVTFRVVRGGVDRFADTATNFLTQNWLTWQPTVKTVTYYSPEFLTYYAVQACTVKLKAYYSETENETISVVSFDAGKAYTLPLQYATVARLLGNKLPGYYDVWTESADGQRLTYIQRYVASPARSRSEEWILFENSLGGLDTFRAYGVNALNAKHTHNIAELDKESNEYRVDTDRLYTKNTGYLSPEESRWLLDFFPSVHKYIYISSYLRAIVVTESQAKQDLKKEPASYSFTYKYADSRPLLNLPRMDEPVEILDIKIPELGNFTLPPRLAEVPRLPLSEGDLFPVQNPYSESWSSTTVGTLATLIGQLLSITAGDGGSVVHSHKNIDLLNLLYFLDDYLLVDGKKINAGYADKAGSVEGMDNKFLRKDQTDITKYLIKFLGGLEIGEAIDSLTAGKGIIADDKGRIQADRMELRSSLTVLRLIINEIQSMSGDFSFSDCGSIEKVELLDDGTYRLTLEKRTDTDWTTLGENDVLYSIVNSLLIGGTDYYTSWFRSITKNRNDNTLTVVLYPDNEVPGGKNYPPVEGYNVTRRGNAVVPDTSEAPNERAQSWLLSSREGRIMFLQNVFKPILEDYNYALTLGRFPNAKMIEKLPIGPTDVGVMSKIGVFEKIYEADWNGTIIPKKVDRGEWSLVTAQGDEPYRFVDYETLLENQKVITALEQHTVYHYGCKWGCLIDKTTEEPQWNSAGWTLLEGDKNYHLDFTSTTGWQFFKNNVNTDIAAVVSYANRDITNVLMATIGVEVEWLRDTGNIPADNSWSPTYVDGQKHVIRLTSSDMGSEWGFSVRTVKFICRVFIPVGEDMETVENYVGFRI